MQSDSKIFNVVIGTAGHIDHGKSALVEALTDVHPDRLKEEQERGITIDLGFAPLVLKNGLRVGIIDVPGHERFIKNMVAGATGIDFVLMIVAADDGVMAQTKEHLQIIQLLNVRDGLTVITKKDLADEECLELVKDDVQQFIAGTLLENKPIIAVSSKTGEGIDALREVLEERLLKLSRKPNIGPFRMPIQRVFAKEGFGTVLTGVPLSGHVQIGDELEVLPPAYSGRIKGLHAYKLTLTHAQAGHSTAVNLHGPDIDKQQITRGMVLAERGIFEPVKLLTAQLTQLPNAPWPLKHRAPIRFHSGTAEIQGKVLLLNECATDEERATGGLSSSASSIWVQILLDEPTVASPSDVYILRHQTPLITLGGGRIVDVSGKKLKRGSLEVLKQLEARLKALDTPLALLENILSTASTPMAIKELCAQSGFKPFDARKLLAELIAKKKVIEIKTDAVFVANFVLERLLKSLLDALKQYFQEHTGLKTLELPEWRRRCNNPKCATGSLPTSATDFFDDLLAILKTRGLVVIEGNFASLPGRELKLEGALAKHAEQIEAALLKGGLTPPVLSELESQLNLASKIAKEIRRYLVDTGRIVEFSGIGSDTPSVHFHIEVYEKAKHETLKLFSLKPEQTASEIRQHLNMNRKFVIPLLEIFDQRGITVRVGDKRKLRN